MLISCRRPLAQQASVLFFIASLVWPAYAGAAPVASTSQSVSDLYQQAIANPIRTPDDRDADARRKPLDFLKLTGVQPGMRVLDVSAGGGYSTQLLALVAGSNGMVWAQGPSIRPALKDRLAAHPQTNIVPVAQPFDDPVPSGVSSLDLVTIIFNYHDIAYMPVDRRKMDLNLFKALKPGGHLVVIDHSAKAGTGTTATKTLHRIDEAVVKKEFQQAGFKLEEESDAFRNPADPRDQPFFKMSMPTDSFALRFVKP
jgi:predicted methyltransferase